MCAPPTVEGMTEILDALDVMVEEGHMLCLHCTDGLGRTGVAEGCSLVGVHHELSVSERMGSNALLKLD